MGGSEAGEGGGIPVAERDGGSGVIFVEILHDHVEHASDGDSGGRAQALVASEAPFLRPIFHLCSSCPPLSLYFFGVISNDKGQCYQDWRKDWTCSQGRSLKGRENWGEGYMRIRIDMEIGKAIPKGFVLKREGAEELWIDFRYERLPDLCFECGHLRHVKKWCHQEADPTANRIQARATRYYTPWIRASNKGD
ncbi:hypothetical protein RJ639_028787 [Escallonia herrerae]|uniref:Zinc knuckle CX2CX4HX4C domain-containing protein n=1 Tax=Escallonia herrerae TaxID=1293975 RepID=A0AA89BKZ7_9ASTE|nr:hypothetical protein RJ639_028787 [Escallonia herrerae]